MVNASQSEQRPRGLSAWWHRRWHRRILAGGGYIPGVTKPVPMPFVPTPVDAQAETEWVVQLATDLVPAIDEALRKPLDNEINARADRWIAQVHSEYATHAAEVRFAYQKAVANVSQETHLQPPDAHRFVETETARNSAALRLRGEHQKPDWAEPGHDDPALLAGRSRDGFLYLFALLVAAIADIVAFYQVVGLLLSNLTPHEIVVLVVAFTVIALLLAHFVGTMLRDRRAGAKWIHALLIIFPAVCWLGLGVLAFWVRLDSNFAQAPSYHLPGQTSAPSSGQSGSDPTLAGAAMFAGLYAATGAVALVGGYLHRNPVVAAFMHAVRQHRMASEKQALSARRLRLAEAERDYFADEMAAAERVKDEAIQARHALAEELKQRARLEYAKRLRDASATDAFFDDDARPYTYRAFPN
jgi:hypothetical protein